MDNLAKTIMVTTKCSAGCVHCPFSSSEMKNLSLSVERIIFLMESSQEELVILSGGEFFEYGQLTHLFEKLKMKSIKKFRIATGNYIPLNSYIQELRNLQNLDGISIGTDTFRDNPDQWINNLRLLQTKHIPYSLTFTLIKKYPFFLDFFLAVLAHYTLKPQFIYLRVDEDSLIAKKDEIQKLKTYFNATPFIEDIIH